ncbi:DUF1127 domain-containing protein [Mesorhizobium sp. LHD-90]|uniref:DUF1127 domain-containing protein n=1 Tax=Mesorhizobium sp. LHD-90 TaxID=3071414 RepID=UPI0027E10599|nr:DUF1127 domain-containing protein [Mesorhizobium sp. LHD-90]MDQ6435182.1 DUF1127 domain-containing protein [Mesorhizobium sp. LHD-90]
MAAFDFATETTRAARRPVTQALGLTMISQLYTTWRNRRAFYRLGEMTDSELRDIGLTRADLHVAVAQPFGIDPTTRLRSIVESRAEQL